MIKNNIPHYISKFIEFFYNNNFIEAEKIATQLSKNFPNHQFGWKALGSVYSKAGKTIEAINAFKKTLDITPGDFEVLNNLGVIYENLGKLDQAIFYFEQSIILNKNFFEANYNLANLLVKKGELEKAVSKYKEAIKLNKKNFQVYANLGHALSDLENYNDAINYYNIALEIKPDHAILKSRIINNKKKINDFTVENVLKLEAERLGIITDAIDPFMALSWVDNPKQQLLRAQNYSLKVHNIKKISSVKFSKKNHNKIKIGYLSSDFYNFASAHLVAGVLENHDRQNFEIYAFYYGSSKNDFMTKKIKSNVDHFIELGNFSSEKIKKIVNYNDIHIAVDMNCYTKNSRTEVFQSRISPIQINYLGYPGTSGTDFMDYIIADFVVIPKEQREYYSEKIIYLPHTYQPNDNKRKIDQNQTSRSDFNLPEKGFVLCCFNQNYKIGYDEFSIWMRLLKKIKGSVLWLLKPNHQAIKNLKTEAKNFGINPEKIIFADKISPSKHLARHKHADLFIDTFNYNAHTTASDALWSGLPIVTKIGQQFSARVAASLLSAIGMPELITKSKEEYEKLILDLALNPEKLLRLKVKLSNNKLKKPLFNTKLYTRNLESGFQAAYELYCNGNKPKDILLKTK